MKLMDKSGGFWTNLIVRQQSGDLAIEQSLIPNERLMRKLGEEAISSIKGSVRHTIVTILVDGKLTFNTSQNGTYPYGIFKRTTPDGEPYQPLDLSTLRYREWKFEQGEADVNRGKSFILRETSTRIVGGLHIQNLRHGNITAGVDIGWDGHDEEVALLQDKGGETSTPWFDEGDRTVQIPARHFRGFQEEFMNNFYSILDEIFK